LIERRAPALVEVTEVHPKFRAKTPSAVACGAGTRGMAAASLAFHVSNGLTAGLWKLMAGVIVVASVLIAVGTARLVRWLPERLAKYVHRLPSVHSRSLIGAALLVSFLAQVISAVTGHILIASLSDRVQLADSLVNVPLIGVMQYVPVAIGGAGVREMGFVALYAAAQVRAEDAFAAGLSMGVMQYLLSALGGLAQWLPHGRSGD
jgi:uncharacterized membrane protein YbhN (UPF0104 family)